MFRKILHVDLDAFFCAVEELRDPSLKGKPIAVGGKANQRGVVASCSYAARMYGVHSAMPMARAMKLCPNLIVISGRHTNYGEKSQQVMDILDISPLFEKVSIDEAFIDITGLPEPVIEIATNVQTRVNTDLKLPISIGGASNKLLAKIANDWGKSKNKSAHPPNTITIVPPGQEAEFLAPLKVQSLWGIGPKTAEKLAGIGIKTIGDLASTPNTTLELLFGRFGSDLRQRALGIDHRPVTPDHDIKSISNEITFIEDIHDERELLSKLRFLSEKVGYRLRNNSLAGNTIQVKIRWADFTTITRQKTLQTPTYLDQEIYLSASFLFKENWPHGKSVRLLGVGVSGLTEPFHQLHLWNNEFQKSSDLLKAVDEIKDRFGIDKIKRAKQIKPNKNTDHNAKDQNSKP